MDIQKIQFNNGALTPTKNSSSRINSARVSNNTHGAGNIGFKGLHVTPETLKKIGCTREMLLNNPSIKECAEKFDVLVTAGKRKYIIDRHDGFTKDKYLPAAYLIGTIYSAPHIVEWLTAIGINDFETIVAIASGMLALAGASIIKIVTQRLNEICVQGASKVEKTDTETFSAVYYDTLIAKGVKTPVYNVKRDPNGIIKDVPELARPILENEYERFYSAALKDANLDDMYTPQKYLAELEKIENAARKLGIEDVFKYPINRGGDTLLTAFFDVAIPDRNDFDGMETYYKILQHIANTDKSNFDKSDSHGISILEKIMNAENQFVLPMIRGSKFSYSPYLKHAYKNIQNDLFKEQLKRTIDFDFSLLEKDK